ncbi:MAG: M56 family metallopeptidase [Planctomycetia bacterium]|nr:M56 family metallopeptidase [Planctomycetia bacterium]
MNDVLILAAHNALVALILALFVLGITSIRRNPPLAHVLWVLVLIKLIVPPVWRIDWSPLLDQAPNAELRPSLDQRPIWRTSPSVDRSPAAGSIGRIPNEPIDPLTDSSAILIVTQKSTSLEATGGLAESFPMIWQWVGPVLFWGWLVGAAAFALISGRRIVRFERLLRDTLPSPAHLQRLAHEIAAKIGVKRVPRICYVDSIDIPLVWSAGPRPTIVLPRRLFRELDRRTAGMILAHELAHVRRRDHWVRAVELIVGVVYWWNPLAWFIRSRIHETEDQCCDAWVRWAFPECERRYAEILLNTAETLSHSRAGATLPAASPLFHSFSLKARIEMILRGRFTPHVTARSLLTVGLFLPMVVSSFLPLSRIEAQVGTDDRTAAADANRAEQQDVPIKSERANRSEFPYALKIEQGTTEFLKGDEITILEVRGTAEVFEAGHLYWIRGTYKLASRDRAMLAAYTTATSDQGNSVTLKVQSTLVSRGTGSFTLFLPMPYMGWPHVSFYPAEGGNSFGENYFGTGDSVKKPQGRLQGAKTQLPQNVTYTWTDSKGTQYVERWALSGDAGRLVLVEQTAKGVDLPLEGAAQSDRSDMPSPEAVLRSLPRLQQSSHPIVSTTALSNVRIAVEKIVDQIGQERSYPLVGQARHHRRHYKCTVSYDDIVSSDWPIPLSHTDSKTEVVYVDHDSLVRTD